MHLSLERLMSTVVLLSLALEITSQIFVTNPISYQPVYGLEQEMLKDLLGIWAIDIVAISLSVDHVSLTLSVIPFLCIFPATLVISMADYETLRRIISLAVITIVFVVARYIANSM